MRKVGVYMLLFGAFFLVGCSIYKEDTKRVRDVEFTVVDKEDAPQELQDMMEEKQAEDMRLSYGEEGYLYVVRGYGKQKTSGYSVEVVDCYETEDAICVETNLLGPPKGEEIVKTPTYPSVIIKMEYSDKNINFY